MDYEITNLTNELVDTTLIEDVINLTSKKLKIKSSIVSIVLTNDKHIHEINKTYRKVDSPTDVISFAFLDDDINPEIDITNLGEIYISLDRAHAQAENYNHSFTRELCFLTVHGLLHLLGYDHMIKEDEKVMFSLQEEILKDLGVER